jgi:hypothetical protein
VNRLQDDSKDETLELGSVVETALARARNSRQRTSMACGREVSEGTRS